MINSDDAKKVMSEHFRQITLQEFNELQGAYVVKEPMDLVSTEYRIESHGRILYQREAAPLSLNAYFASALTTLDEMQRRDLLQVSALASKVL